MRAVVIETVEDREGVVTKFSTRPEVYAAVRVGLGPGGLRRVSFSASSPFRVGAIEALEYAQCVGLAAARAAVEEEVPE